MSDLSPIPEDIHKPNLKPNPKPDPNPSPNKSKTQKKGKGKAKRKNKNKEACENGGEGGDKKDVVVGGGVTIIQPTEKRGGLDLEKLAKNKKGWEDITEKMRTASKGMKMGRMIHGPDFSLYEAMSALEIMDPKMDPGMKSVKYSEEEKRQRAKVAKELKRSSELTDAEILAIMDRCIACFVSWSQGHTLCHTILTCLYLRTENVEDEKIPKVLRVFAIGLLRLCKEVRDIVMKADIYEEEDFMTNLFKFSLCEEKPQTLVLHDIETVQASLESKKGDNLSIGLASRLGLIRNLWMMHQALGDRKVAETKEILLQIGKDLGSVRETQKLGSEVAYGFDLDIPREIVPHHPPRIVATPTPLETTLYFLSLLKHIKRMLRVKEDIPKIEDALLYFQGLSVETPGIVARSHLLLMLKTEGSFMGKGHVSEFVRESFRRFCPSFDIAELDSNMSLFLERVSKPVCLIFRLFCENRARQRRKIGKLLADWNILQQDASVLDRKCQTLMSKNQIPMGRGVVGVPYQHPCFSWVFDQTLCLLTHYIELGLELGLYARRELPPAYWYLEYLLNYRLQNRTMTTRSVDSKYLRKLDIIVATNKKSEAKGRKNRRKKNKKSAAKPPATAEILMIEAKKDLCRGLYKTMQGLSKTGTLSFPELPFGSDELNFKHRYKEFLQVQQPVPLTYHSYLNHNQVENTSIQLLLGVAYKSFESAKIISSAALTRTSLLPADLLQTKKLIKVAKMNMITLMVTQKAMKESMKKGDTTAEQMLCDYAVEFDFSVHMTFPIINLPLPYPLICIS